MDIQGLADFFVQLDVVNRFGDETEHPAAGGVHRFLNGTVRRHDNDRQGRIMLVNLFVQRQAVHFFHPQIGEYQMRVEGGQFGQGLGAAADGFHFQPQRP